MTPPESYVTPAIKELFKPQFATQDPDIFAVLLKTRQDFAETLIRWPNAPTQPADMVTAVGILEQRGRITVGVRWIPRLAVPMTRCRRIGADE